MSASTAEDFGGWAERPNKRLSLARHGAELGLVALFVLTAAIIGFQHQLFDRETIVSGATANHFVYSGYADQANGGRSTFAASSQPLAWSCELRSGAASITCGYEVVFDENGSLRGLDLRNLETIRLTLDYHGPATTLRLHVKNEDPRYSKHGDRLTAKMNKVEFSVRDGRQTVVFRPNDFSVADWWIAGKNLAPELGRTQLDDVVSAEIATGSGAPVGHYSFRIRSLTLERSTIAPAELYLLILGAWGLLIPLYMLLRLRRGRRDASEKEHAQAEARAALANAKEAAERASKAKSDFLARMSHELRTPLNAVLGYAQLLERADLSAEHLGAVRTIHRSGHHLLSLISDILDLSKIEAGKMELYRAPVDVRAAMASVSEMVRVPAEQKGLAFRCSVGEDVPEAIEADEKRLRQILLNLLSNAVKFTAEGRVSLLVTLVRRADNTARLRFEVQDSGPGIAEDELERIFRPFEQVGDFQRQEGGTGLGLTISRQLAALMGATIEVQSRIGQGASFWFEASFAVAEAPADDAVISSVEISGYAGGRRRVLVVDDNPENGELLCDLLQQLGFETDAACDGREAVRLSQLKGPDLILMDLNMPIMDGHEAIRLIRLIEPLKTVPILAVSAVNADEGEASSSLAGADGFVGKPIDKRRLLAAIGRVLKLEWITEQPRADRIAAPAPADAEPAVQKRVWSGAERPLRILAAEDNPTNQVILRAVLQTLDVELQLVSDGVEAVEAFRDRSFDVVLMDVQMPGMTGMEATRAIRRLEAEAGRPRTPIIALSANVMADHIADYRAAGMDAHLDKPIVIEQLYRLLENVSAGALQPAQGVEGFASPSRRRAPGRA